MTTNIWFWLIIVLNAFIVFFMMLNTYLRGSLKQYIDAILSILWVILLVISFILFGWKISLSLIIGSFVWGAITLPFADRLAKKILNS